METRLESIRSILCRGAELYISQRTNHSASLCACDSEFMSVRCAKRCGFKIDRSESARRTIQMADGSLANAIGQVPISSLELGQYGGFERDFHVLPGLQCDLIFGEEFLEQIDTFNTCPGLRDCDDESSYDFNIMINLGRIQKFGSNIGKRLKRRKRLEEASSEDSSTSDASTKEQEE